MIAGAAQLSVKNEIRSIKRTKIYYTNKYGFDKERKDEEGCSGIWEWNVEGVSLFGCNNGNLFSRTCKFALILQ